MDFPGRKGCRFLNISIMYHCAKKKNQAEGLTDRQTPTQTQIDRHTDRPIENDDFIGPSVGRGSSFLEKPWKVPIKHRKKKNLRHFQVKTRK